MVYEATKTLLGDDFDDLARRRLDPLALDTSVLEQMLFGGGASGTEHQQAAPVTSSSSRHLQLASAGAGAGPAELRLSPPQFVVPPSSHDVSQFGPIFFFAVVGILVLAPLVLAIAVDSYRCACAALRPRFARQRFLYAPGALADEWALSKLVFEYVWLRVVFLWLKVRGWLAWAYLKLEAADARQRVLREAAGGTGGPPGAGTAYAEGAPEQDLEHADAEEIKAMELARKAAELRRRATLVKLVDRVMSGIFRVVSGCAGCCGGRGGRGSGGKKSFFSKWFGKPAAFLGKIYRFADPESARRMEADSNAKEASTREGGGAGVDGKTSSSADFAEEARSVFLLNAQADLLKEGGVLSEEDLFLVKKLVRRLTADPSYTLPFSITTLGISTSHNANCVVTGNAAGTELFGPSCLLTTQAVGGVGSGASSVGASGGSSVGGDMSRPVSHQTVRPGSSSSAESAFGRSAAGSTAAGGTSSPESSALKDLAARKRQRGMKRIAALTAPADGVSLTSDLLLHHNHLAFEQSGNPALSQEISVTNPPKFGQASSKAYREALARLLFSGFSADLLWEFCCPYSEAPQVLFHYETWEDRAGSGAAPGRAAGGGGKVRRTVNLYEMHSREFMFSTVLLPALWRGEGVGRIFQ